MDYVLYVVIGVVIIILIWWISTSNKLKKMTIKVDESLSGIDIALTKRYEVLTKMIEVVKGYVKHEKETLFEVVKLRKEMTLPEKITENQKMDNNMQKINVLVENYPDLKASENFMVLQKAIIDVEEHLQASRRLYNSNVTLYNDLVMLFPSNIVAKVTGKKAKDFFKATDKQKEYVKVDI
jgi:LemA protein